MDDDDDDDDEEAAEARLSERNSSSRVATNSTATRSTTTTSDATPAHQDPTVLVPDEIFISSPSPSPSTTPHHSTSTGPKSPLASPYRSVQEIANACVLDSDGSTFIKELLHL